MKTLPPELQLSPKQIEAVVHLTIGPNGQCLCGVHGSATGGVALRCCDIIAANLENRILEQMPEFSPSGGHDVIDELIGLLRVAHSSRDTAEDNWVHVATQAKKYKRALNLALDLLIKHEPGDSRAVSNEFVALASVLAGNDDKKAWDIIDDAREAGKILAIPGFDAHKP